MPYQHLDPAEIIADSIRKLQDGLLLSGPRLLWNCLLFQGFSTGMVGNPGAWGLDQTVLAFFRMSPPKKSPLHSPSYSDCMIWSYTKPSLPSWNPQNRLEENESLVG
jgi:hypothetical protein